MAFSGFDLTGKVMMIVGAGRGIGRSVAICSAEAGADLILTSRTREELDSAAEEIRKLGRKAAPVVFDVSKVADVRRGFAEAIAAFGKLDVVVNNAGTNVPKMSLDVTEEDWDLILDTNLKGLFFCCQEAGRHMVERKQGKVINISSQMGVVGGPKRAPYCASKGGVCQLTKALAIEWAPYSVTVNAVAPTFIRTPLAEVFLKDEAFRKDVISRIPLGHIGEPEDVAGAVIYLASNAANLVTGHTLCVDGGWTIQ